MADKLKKRTFDTEIGNASTSWSISISPSGKFVIIWNGINPPVFWKWNGAQYIYDASNPVAAGLMGEYTADEAYMVVLSQSTTQHLQLRSVNATTGATTLLSSLNNSTITTPNDGSVKHIGGDYFIVYAKNAVSTFYLVKLNRANNTLNVVDSAPVSDANFYITSDVAAHPTRIAAIWGQRNGGSYGFNFVRVNTGTQKFEFANPIVNIGTQPVTSVDISDSGQYFYANVQAAPSQNRSGTINFDTLTSTLNTTIAGQPGTFSSFVFGDKGIFTPKVSGSSPFDQYQLHNAGVISADPGGTFSPMDQPTGPFLGGAFRRKYDRNRSKPRVHALVANTSNAVGLYVFEEYVEPVTANLFALGPMGDAFSNMTRFSEMNAVAVGPMGDATMTSRLNESVSYFALGLMGDAFAPVVVDESALLFAAGPMGDAFARLAELPEIRLNAIGPMGDAFAKTSDINIQGVAVGPMGDAFSSFLSDEDARFVAIGPMGDAISLVQVNDEYSFFGVGPMGDGSVRMSQESVSFFALGPMGEAFVTSTVNEDVEFIAVGPMGEAFTRLSDEHARFYATGPMGEAWSDVLVNESANFTALGPMGDAFADVRPYDLYTFAATGPMGEAWSEIIVEENGDLVAIGPMGDALISLLVRDGIDAVAVGPMGDAFAPVIVRESLRGLALGPMGDAISLVQVNDDYSLVGIGPMGDAEIEMAEGVDKRVSFVAVGPMGDAFFTTTNDGVRMVAVGPMGDAGIGLSSTDRCRRRAMMVINVL